MVFTGTTDCEANRRFHCTQNISISVHNIQYSSMHSLFECHPWSKTNLSSSSEKAGFAAATKEKEKNVKYFRKALSLGHLFRPIAIEVFGRWGEGAEETLKEVSLLAPSVLGVPYGQFKRDWAVQLAVCLQMQR